MVGTFWPNGSHSDQTGDNQYHILLVNGPIHYDILIPISVARRDMAWLSKQGIALDHPDVRWLVVGWGARDFYTTIGTYRDISAKAIWRGITGDSAVMQVSVAGPLEDTWPSIALDATQMRRLTNAITEDFAQGAQTQAIDHPGFSDLDRFFAAKGRFHIFQTCNAWVGNIMRQSGVAFGLWTPTPYVVTLAHRRFQSE